MPTVKWKKYLYNTKYCNTSDDKKFIIYNKCNTVIWNTVISQLFTVLFKHLKNIYTQIMWRPFYNECQRTEF